MSLPWWAWFCAGFAASTCLIVVVLMVAVLVAADGAPTEDAP